MIEQNTFTIIFGIFLVMTCREMFFGNSKDTADISKADHLHHHSQQHGSGIDGIIDTPSHAAGNIQERANIKIQYCHSCGYRQAFEDISRLLKASYPDIRITGEYHQPGFFKTQIVNLLFVTKFAILGMIFMDINPFNYLQMETPQIWNHLVRSKISSSLFIFFISNSIETSMMSTGAFEIFFNDYPIWSKIQTGRMPSSPELMQIVGSQFNIGKINPNFVNV